jgi:hypothetical protein
MITAGILITCFSGAGAFDQGVLSLNFIMNILPGIVIIATGIVSRFYPKAGSIAILIITLYLSYFILRRGVNWSSAGTALLVLVPLLAASFGLWRVIEEKEV